MVCSKPGQPGNFRIADHPGLDPFEYGVYRWQLAHNSTWNREFRPNRVVPCFQVRQDIVAATEAESERGHP
jgi:hypothetical protein